MASTDTVQLTDSEQQDLDAHIAERGDRFATAYWSARRFDHPHVEAISAARWATS